MTNPTVVTHAHSAPALILALAATLLLPATTPATTHPVGDDATYATIPAALAAASEGDTILVHRGTYLSPENVEMDPQGKNCVYRSTEGPDVTIIEAFDATSTRFVFRFDSGESDATLIEGFTFQNAYHSGEGSALIIAGGSSPVITNCVFQHNTAYLDGGAVHVSGAGSSPSFQGCVFRENSSLTAGGAVSVEDGASPAFNVCLFDLNDFPSGGYNGGAVYVSGASPVFENCTFVENDLSQLYAENGSNLQVSLSIIAHGPAGPGVSVEDPSDATLERCVVYANAGGNAVPCQHTDVLFEAPLFCDHEADDYTLCADSPCLPANNPWGSWVGARGQGCPTCGTAVEPASWGLIKSLYR